MTEKACLLAPNILLKNSIGSALNADLMNIYEPSDVAEVGRAMTVFAFPSTMIEDVLMLDSNRQLVIDDNNCLGSAAREFGVSTNHEFIVLRVTWTPLANRLNGASEVTPAGSSRRTRKPEHRRCFWRNHTVSRR